MPDQKKYKWYKIAGEENELIFNDAGLLQVDVAGKKICLAKVENKILACTAKCPHAGGILADGFIDAKGNIVCPLHRYRYDPANGRNVSGEGYFLKTYPVDITSEGVFVGISGGGLLGLFK